MALAAGSRRRDGKGGGGSDCSISLDFGVLQGFLLSMFSDSSQSGFRSSRLASEDAVQQLDLSVADAGAVTLNAIEWSVIGIECTSAEPTSTTPN